MLFHMLQISSHFEFVENNYNRQIGKTNKSTITLLVESFLIEASFHPVVSQRAETRGTKVKLRYMVTTTHNKESEFASIQDIISKLLPATFPSYEFPSVRLSSVCSETEGKFRNKPWDRDSFRTERGQIFRRFLQTMITIPFSSSCYPWTGIL